MGAEQSSCGVKTEGRRLLKAVEDGHVADVGAALRHNLGFVYWSTFSGGNTVWHKAAKSGQLGILKAMAHAVESAYSAPKDTEEGHQLQALLKVGPSPQEAVKRLVNLVNFKRCTPLMLAAARGHTEVVEWLLQQGAMLLIHDRIRHQTALHYAIIGGNIDCVRLLLGAAAHTAPAAPGTAQRGPTERQLLLSSANHAGLTALHYAVHEERYDAMKLLLSSGADINAQAEYPDLDWASVNAGDTPMHVAAAKGSIEAIRILLKGFVETSGLLCPEHAPPRHIRDPRGVRNDYGRLPYHLAMRKQFTWLSELLDPSVPVRYLLTGEQPDTATSLGPPRLAVTAAKVLHEKLMAELAQLKDEACGGGGGGAAAAAVMPMNSLQAARAAESAAAAARTPPRRWTLTGMRRSSSGAGGGGGRGGGGARAAGGGSGGGAGGGSSPAARATVERLLALPGRVAEVAVGSGHGGSVDVRDAGVSQPSRSRTATPRVSISGAGSGQGTEEGADGGAAAASPLAAAFAHVTVALSASAGLNGAKRKHAGSAAADGASDGGSASGLIQAHVPHCELEPQAAGGGGGSSGASSSSSGGGGGSGESAGEAEKVLNPELLDEGHGGPSVLDGLLRGFRRTTCNRVAPAGHHGGLSSSDDGISCGVCLDALPATAILPCKHVMCVDCALDMCKRYSLGTAACPFCRALVAGFRQATHDEMRQH